MIKSEIKLFKHPNTKKIKEKKDIRACKNISELDKGESSFLLMRTVSMLWCAFGITRLLYKDYISANIRGP